MNMWDIPVRENYVPVQRYPNSFEIMVYWYEIYWKPNAEVAK